MGTPLVPPPAVREEFATREGCFITELLNSAAVPASSLARARVEPGVTTELHSLDVDEWYVIESGRGRVEVGDAAPLAVQPGDSVAIPAGVAQRIANDGDSDLVFLCLCVPRFRPQGYRPLES